MGFNRGQIENAPELGGLFMAEQAASVRTKAKKEIILGSVGCDTCILKSTWPQLLSPKMKMKLPPGGVGDVEILVLGEAPQIEDDVAGYPFSPKSEFGELLQDRIPQRYRERMAWQSVVRCRVPGDASPTHLDMTACSGHLLDDIARLPNLKVILGIGGKPLASVEPLFSIHEIHGMQFPIEIAGRVLWYYPIIHPSYVLENARDGYKVEQSHVFPLFMNDLRRFFKNYDTMMIPFIYKFSADDVILPTTEADAQGLIDRMNGLIGFDLETFQLRPYMRDAKMLTAAFSDGTTTIAFPVDHPAGPTEWGRRLVMKTTEERRWVAHSGAMELSWIWWDKGIEWYPDKFEDTMALGRVVHARESNQSLGAMTRIHLGTNVKTLSNIDTKNIMNYTLDEVLPYNGIDAAGGVVLFAELETKANNAAWAEYETLMRTTRSCVAMELAGLPVDLKVNQALHKEFSDKIEAAQRASRDVYEVQAFERKYGRTFNIAAQDDVGRALVEFGRVKLPTSKSGRQYVTDDEELEKVASTNPLAALVQEYREAAKNLATYVEPFSEKMLPPDGMIHPQYKTTFTKTLRLSSEDPNIQNQPKHKNRHIRKQVTADIRWVGWGVKTLPVTPGKHLIVAVDSGQIQALVLGMVTKDRKLCDAIITGYDIHVDWRDRLLADYPEYMDHVRHKSGETDEKKLMKAARGEIKSDFVFSSMFGAGAKSCADRIGAPLHIMKRLQEDFFGVFSTVKRWIKNKRAQYAETGETFSPCGTRRYSLLTGNEPLNNPIQAGEREIIIGAQNALCEMALKTGDYYLMPRISIHDDLTFIIKDDENLEKRISIIADEMNKVRWDWQILPLMVEVSIGENWCDLEEIAKMTGDYVRR